MLPRYPPKPNCEWRHPMLFISLALGVLHCLMLTCKSANKQEWDCQASVSSVHQEIIKAYISNMIPPTASLVKYDNPVLVSRNTEKKSPRVSLTRYCVILIAYPYILFLRLFFYNNQYFRNNESVIPVLIDILKAFDTVMWIIHTILQEGKVIGKVLLRWCECGGSYLFSPRLMLIHIQLG